MSKVADKINTLLNENIQDEKKELEKIKKNMLKSIDKLQDGFDSVYSNSMDRMFDNDVEMPVEVVPTKGNIFDGALTDENFEKIDKFLEEWKKNIKKIKIK